MKTVASTQNLHQSPNFKIVSWLQCWAKIHETGTKTS